MKNVAYINETYNFEQNPLFADLISRCRCSKLYKEKLVGATRPVWNQMIDDLEDGDTVTFLSFNNAFRNIREMTMFLKLSSVKNIRIVSFMDSLDSNDTAFVNSNTKNTFEVISKLPLCGDIDYDNLPKGSLKAINARNARLKKYQIVVNMYKGGFSVSDIMARVDIKSKSTIYYILHKYDISLDYPKMARLKKTPASEQHLMRLNKL